jgi:NADH:ubiquinone oxidoreductase subunit 3 (subunit A)
MIFEYFLIFLFLFFAIAISFILFLLFYLIIYRHNEFEKISAYECGFNPFEDAYGRFDIKFYLVAILFLIFDLEVVFLFPWCVSLSYFQLFNFWVMLIFLLILTLGFIYEWRRGALDW